MRLSKKSLVSSKLYLILDAEVLGHQALLEVLKDTVRAGVDIVQLRDKRSTVKDILAFCHKALKVTKNRIPFIVNDRADLSILSGADGLHVGQDDLDYTLSRRLLGGGKIIGVSCQNISHALKAEQEGADYIGFGSIFKTKTKPERQAMDLELLAKVVKRVRIPVFAIGGISRENIDKLIPLGVRRVAVCRDILLAKDPARAVKDLKKAIDVRG